MHPSPHSSARPETPRSRAGGRHELGQNFLVHEPTVTQIVDLVRTTRGPILEIGPGSGAITTRLAALHRPLTLIELDEHRVRELRRRFPGAEVLHADATRASFDRPVVVGNLPFHLTTPLLRRLLGSPLWERAILLTQWEVARKRAGVGGGTMLTAQTCPWFEFRLRGRVPARAFRPMPSVDGGILDVSRRIEPLVPLAERLRYERFVRRVFTSRGHGLTRILNRGLGRSRAESIAALRQVGAVGSMLPRDLAPEQWAGLWQRLGARDAGS